MVSYGPCQFPTLGFVVRRCDEIERFEPEEFWYIEAEVARELNGEACSVVFNWALDKMFCQYTVGFYYMDLIERSKFNPDEPRYYGTIRNVTKKPVTKFKPKPLSTEDMQKLAITRLRIGAKQVMDLANELYQKGYISYPRSETNMYNASINLKDVVAKMEAHERYGQYACRLLAGAYEAPRNGNKSDNAHPPIYPIKPCDGGVSPDAKKLHELIVSHFLAQCSSDAKGEETEIKLDIGGHHFSTKGTVVTKKNFLEVFYQPWGGKELPSFSPGEIIECPKVLMKSGTTSPPKYLTEADLLTQMSKAGIGTDATQASHIQMIQDRMYAYKDQQFIKATPLGTALV